MVHAEEKGITSSPIMKPEPPAAVAGTATGSEPVVGSTFIARGKKLQDTKS